VQEPAREFSGDIRKGHRLHIRRAGALYRFVTTNPRRRKGVKREDQINGRGNLHRWQAAATSWTALMSTVRVLWEIAGGHHG